MKLIMSKKLSNYNRILESFIDDWGYVYYHAILVWCGIIKDKDFLSNEMWEVYLIEHNRKICGVAGLYSHNDNRDELWLGWFGILPELRSKGIGTKALNLVEKKALKFGCKKMMAYVDKKGKPLSFYYRNGWKRCCNVRQWMNKHPECDKSQFEGMNDHVISKTISGNI